jgi:hypothetical protein
MWDQAYWYGMFLLVWFLVQFFADFVLNLDGDRYYIVAFGILFEL